MNKTIIKLILLLMVSTSFSFGWIEHSNYVPIQVYFSANNTGSEFAVKFRGDSQFYIFKKSNFNNDGTRFQQIYAAILLAISNQYNCWLGCSNVDVLGFTLQAEQ